MRKHVTGTRTAGIVLPACCDAAHSPAWQQDAAGAPTRPGAVRASPINRPHRSVVPVLAIAYRLPLPPSLQSHSSRRWLGVRLPRPVDNRAAHITARGFVSIPVDYRVKSREQSAVFDSVHDARSAMRWVRSHAAELKIDSTKDWRFRWSAGGHVSSATALPFLSGIDVPADKLGISPVPAALVLFNQFSTPPIPAMAPN